MWPCGATVRAGERRSCRGLAASGAGSRVAACGLGWEVGEVALGGWGVVGAGKGGWGGGAGKFPSKESMLYCCCSLVRMDADVGNGAREEN